MELFEQIRRDRDGEGLSIRALARASRGASPDGQAGVGVGGAAGAQAAG